MYLHEGQLVSKITGGRWALDQGVGPSAGIRRALAAQIGSESITDITSVEVDFVQNTANRLSA